MRTVTHKEVADLAAQVARGIRETYGHQDYVTAYAIPRGGVPAAYAVQAEMANWRQWLRLSPSPQVADIFIDDIIDSGSTMKRFLSQYPDKGFYALLDKQHPSGFCKSDTWIVWPWEGTVESSVEDNIVRILEYVGEDPHREGLADTPRRVARAWKDWCAGYSMKPEDVLKVFEDGAKGVDEMVVVRVPVYSHCEHHLAAIFGEAVVAYIPNGRIVGLSKIKRLVDVFARRLQVQERLTNQIADALEEHLKPLGVGVVVRARHMCMESRGVNVNDGEPTITSALRGAVKDKPEARAEFLSLAR